MHVLFEWGWGVKGEIVCVHASGRLLRMITFRVVGWGVPNGFIYFEFLYFGLSEKTLFQTILGLIGISIRSVL